MKLVLLSDIHGTSKIPKARIDNPIYAFKRKIEFVFKTADKLNAPILHAGDLFNSPRDIFALFKFLSITAKYPNVKFYTIYGQHDLYFRNKNTLHNLGILSKAGIIKILNNKRAIDLKSSNNETISAYGSGWKDKITIPIQHSFNVLAIHSSITTESLWQGMKYNTAKSFIEKHPFDLIICGDIHRDFIYKTDDKRIICNTGPLMRLEATQYNLQHKPKLYIFDTEKRTIKTIVIPHADANQVLSKKHLEIVETNDALGNIYINSKDVEEIKVIEIINMLIQKSNKEERLKKILLEIIDDHDYISQLS